MDDVVVGLIRGKHDMPVEKYIFEEDIREMFDYICYLFTEFQKGEQNETAQKSKMRFFIPVFISFFISILYNEVEKRRKQNERKIYS